MDKQYHGRRCTSKGCISLGTHGANVPEQQSTASHSLARQNLNAGIDQDFVEKSQFLEPFLAKGIEMLYFTVPIDEYMAQNLGSFQSKKFKNIATENVKVEDKEDTDLVVTRREKYYTNQFKPLRNN
jgi:HSP90 family molecular chaperone